MKKHLLALACLGLLTAACTRSVTSATLPTATEDPLSSVFNTIATQTALAAGGKGATAPATNSNPSPTPMLGATATLASSPTSKPTAASTPAPITELPVPHNYVLHEGEWPYCLARRFNIDPAAILTANNLTEQEASQLSVGAKLAIPVDQVGTYGSSRELRPHPASYTSTSTDTFFSIACAFGDVWPEHIAEANGMELDDELRGGTQLHIP